MRCPSCNSRIDNNLTICNYCGAEVHYQNNHEDQYEYSKNYSNVEKEYDDSMQEHIEYSQKYSNSNQDVVTSDEDYVKAYLGNDYNMASKKSFNFFALIFGPFYLSYKKIYPYLWALIGFFCLLKHYLMILNIAISFFASGWLWKNANKKVQKIKEKHIDLSSSELIELCKKEGEGSTLPILITFAILFTILFLIAFQLHSTFENFG